MIPSATRRIPHLLLAGLLMAAPALAAKARDGDLRRLFPKAATVTPAAAGLNRIPLPAGVLAACRPDLADLRLVNASGLEVPFAIVPAPAPEADAEILVRRWARVESVQRHEERPRTGPPIFQETYVLGIPALPRGAARWELELSTRRTSFVCRLEIRTLEDSGPPAHLLESGAAFRLQDPRVQRLRFPLPLRKAGRLELRLSGENGGYLEPLFVLRAFPGPPLPEPLAIALGKGIVSQRQDTTVLDLPRPQGIVPSALRLTTTSRDFLRKVAVWDERADGTSNRVGSGTVFRLHVGAETVEQLGIPLEPTSGPRLRLEIVNGDSPPLDGISVSGLLPCPVLVASLATNRPLSLYFGGGRAHRPRYDLGGLLRRLPGGVSSRLAGIPEAVLGPIASNGAFDPTPVLAFLMHPGAPLDAAPFRHRRLLEVEPSREGLAALTLKPEDLAVLRPDLADLRVTGGDGRQWAYLLAGRTATAPFPVSFHHETAARALSRYELELPATPLPVSGLSLDVDAPFFDRAFRLVARTSGKREVVIRHGRLSRRRGELSSIRLRFGSVRVTRLVLEVEDGGDAPLPMLSTSLDVPRPVLLLPAPAGRYTLLLGHPGARPPLYELASVRSTILAVPASTIDAAPLEANPAFTLRSRLLGGGTPAQYLLWAALALAVVVLVVLTLRLARKTPLE